MKFNIIFAAYRDWALEVLPVVLAHPNVQKVAHVTSNDDIECILKNDHDYDFVLTCGWSTPPSQFIIDNIPVYGEHPVVGDDTISDLYSRGTPLQNQILDGHRVVQHRLFKAGFPELSERSYCLQVPMSLEGSMDLILDQMRSTSITLFQTFLSTYPNVVWSNWDPIPYSSQRTPRTPDDSRLLHDDVTKMSTTQLYDFCRMLEGPYPRAFLEDEHGVLTFERVSYKAKK